MFVLIEEFLPVAAGKGLRFLFWEDAADEVEFGLHHGFVIHGVQRVESFPFGLQGFRQVLFRNELVQIQIKRMQRERGDGGVRIRVQPGMRGAGVIDRQNLDQLETGASAPIGERFQIREFADTKAVFTAQTEDRDGHACTFPSVGGQADETIVHNRVFSVCNGIGISPVPRRKRRICS